MSGYVEGDDCPKCGGTLSIFYLDTLDNTCVRYDLTCVYCGWQPDVDGDDDES